MLRRETAVELPITPSKLATAATTDDSATNITDYYEKNGGNVRNERCSPALNRNLSAEQPYVRHTNPQNYLVPSMSEPTHPRFFKKSIESLQKNSSSDTEYSLQPYKVIKQSSNETNTSLTGSFNVDQSSFGGHDTSLDTTDPNGLNATVVENINRETKESCIEEESDKFGDDNQMEKTLQTAQSLPVPRYASTSSGSSAGPRALKKQFSIDHSIGKIIKPDILDNNTMQEKQSTSNLPPSTVSTIPATPIKLLAGNSSSTSTDESKEERNIPTISTNVVQDEIVKLSTNIKNNDETEDENNKDPPFNETMC